MVTVLEWEGSGMAQRRMQDPTLRPSAIADPGTVRVAFEYLACATFWLLVGTGARLLDALLSLRQRADQVIE